MWRRKIRLVTQGSFGISIILKAKSRYKNSEINSWVYFAHLVSSSKINSNIFIKFLSDYYLSGPYQICRKEGTWSMTSEPFFYLQFERYSPKLSQKRLNA